MFSQLKDLAFIKWLRQSPEFEDKNKQSVAQVLDGFILTVFFMVVPLSPVLFITTPGEYTNFFLVNLVTLTILYLRVPLRRGRVISVATILSVHFVMFTAVFIYFFGTIHSVVTGYLLISIIISAFVLGTRMTFFFSGLSIFAMFVLFCLEQMNILSDSNPGSHLNQMTFFVMLIVFVTKLFQLENINRSKLSHTSLHDGLTQLPNRSLLKTRINLSLQKLKRNPDKRFALLYLDLDRFKVINDSLGHDVGDKVLLSFADALRSMIREIDVAARLGGDEFVVLLDDIEDYRDAVDIAERILGHLEEPMLIDGKSLSFGASIGIILSNTEYQNADEILRDADVAMYLSKDTGKNKYTIFDEVIHQQATDRLELEKDLHLALKQEEFVVAYQPILNLEDQSLRGFEALVRWQHPTRGLVGPHIFIPIAEETGMIRELTQYVLVQALKQLKLWKLDKTVSQETYVSVNLSPQCLETPSYATKLSELVDSLQFDPSYLTLEITEGVLINNIDENIQVLQDLKALGISISIDDFGTGYSSLSYLHRLPLDVLKIDKSFIMGMENDTKNQSITETIVNLGKSLKMKLVAEGIETTEQLQFLQEENCDFGQGFYFAKPLFVEDVPDYCLSLQESHTDFLKKDDMKTMHSAM